ncbi:DoxX family protein [Microbulbifer rhizosphaerae]|uniref:Putative oxidoreductase n=1 Tax=Microbulbifer rhizosphaerae TaxID=1562603 RepID=A0A7W4W8Z2_9GAMM|nr:DoxX family protein [Microbulbifer rhizosphaerae]MBB3059900.1 putative oxidoreductase [Microbulbifer rhizosphaerae]
MAIFHSLCRLANRFREWLGRIPYSLIALLGRFAIAGVFWKSGQTKVEGFAVDLVDGTFQLGWPHLSESAGDLFRDEYQLPLISPKLGALLAATAEHLFPLMLLFGLGTCFAALALLVMTAVIQVFVYPGAWPTHGTWAAIFLMLMAMGPGRLSLDCLLARHFGGR